MRIGATALAAAAFAALAVPSAMRHLRGGDAMPQIASGDGALAVAFGDAREVLGKAMVQKADSYFHGGIDMDCHASHGEEHAHEHGEGCGCGECAHGHEGHGDPEAFDPWAWINSRVRAPRVHRHLAGKGTVELIPWLWASVAASPHDVDAWTTAAYVAGDMMKDLPLALRILEEGEARNPSSVRLRFYEGRARYNRGKGDLASARAAFESARDIALRGGLAALSEEELTAYEFSTNYIAEIDSAVRKLAD